MKIMHYFLGFPPYRTGGLTRFAYDLMVSQNERGDEVTALWPGQMSPINMRLSFKRKKLDNGIHSIEICNPLPVPLDEGIKNPEAYVRGCPKEIFAKMLQEEKPDVIHIHTLMGLYKEFFEAANELNIRTVYTTHDYFGLCPKVTLYRNGKVCDDDHGCVDCINCNKTGLSISRIMIMQSPLYRFMKDTYLVKKLRRNHRNDFFIEDRQIPAQEQDTADCKEYEKLREYYISCLKKIDIMHFNSTVSRDVYERYLGPSKSVVLSITHKKIEDHRSEQKWSRTGKLRLTYLAPAKPYKGFNILTEALDQLWNDGKRDFELHLFTPVKEPSPYMIVTQDGYTQEELKTIFSNTDVLIAPSIWYETFGFTVLEALSYDVPVIVSDHVGAKDIVNQGGVIIRSDNIQDLKRAVSSFSEENLQKFRKHIMENCRIKSWNIFLQEMDSIYQSAGA